MHFSEEFPAAAEYVALFETTGWNVEYNLSAAELAKALQNSQMAACAYEGERLVGFGRVLTDGVMHAMIYDLIVHPEWQGRGVGGELLRRLVERCLAGGVRDIQLFCARGKRSFYEKRGFIARPDDAPGMQRGRRLFNWIFTPKSTLILYK